MPYIIEEHRITVDESIDALLKQLNRHAPEDRGGILNYTVTRLMLGLIHGYPTTRYRHYSALVGDLQCCLMEFYRRHVAPYEDKARERNGDVF